MAYPKFVTDTALDLLDRGWTLEDASRETGVSQATLVKWKKKHGKKKNRINTAETVLNLKKQIAALSQRKPTEANSRRIAMLTRSLNRMEKISSEEKRIRERAKPKPKVSFQEQVAGLREKILSDEYGLYSYQKDFIRSEAQFRIILKARQIGFSYAAGADALLRAMDGHDQLFLSASEEQAGLLMRYTALHAQKLGIVLSGGFTEWRLENGAIIKALAHNFRTVQGFTGDIWMDEFAWYPNPKRIWGAFVPSIGAVKGRLTVMSTPFERDGLFYDLFHNEDRYFMFDRFRVDIHDAMKGGMEFDLETMKALFDADTWFTMYECGFTDDETALFAIDLIKSCVDPQVFYTTPSSKSILFAGYDIGRTRDASALAALIQPETADKEKGISEYCLARFDVLRKATFDEQKLHLESFLNLYPNAALRMDKTGIGMNLTETMIKKYKSRVQGVHFTAHMKEFLCLNLKKLFEDKRITIPNDPPLIAEIHSIKRKAGQKSFLYDADRNAAGHADRFWALALAASHIEGIAERRKGRAWII
jgi:phage FluMu gp28-like protein